MEIMVVHPIEWKCPFCGCMNHEINPPTVYVICSYCHIANDTFEIQTFVLEENE